MDKGAVRKALFTPCRSKEELDRWIRVFLNIRFPDRIVSDESTSSPLEMIWQLYDHAVRNDTDGWKRIMAYANRFGGKTLGAAVLETMIVLHTERNIAHMAAIKDQSKKAQEYVKGFFSKPYFMDFVEGDNASEVVVVAYIHKRDGVVLTHAEWDDLPPSEQLWYRRKENYIRIIACTMQSANGQHVEFFCVDGDTQIAVRDSGNRLRKGISAKGLFRLIQGLSPTGRYYEQEGQVVPSNLVEVFTFDWTTGSFTFRPITFGVCRRSETLEIVTESGKKVVASIDHPVWVIGKGGVNLSDVGPGDKVVTLNRAKSNGKPSVRKPKAVARTFLPPVDDDEWMQVLVGSLLGDGGVYRKYGNNAFYQERHCKEQEDYFLWKVALLSRHLRMRKGSGRSGYTGEEQVVYASGNTPLLNGYEDFKSTLQELDTLGPLGLAVWYMDDGHATNGFKISSCGFSLEQNLKLANFLKSKFQIDCKVVELGGYLYLSGGVEAKRRLVEICRPYVHPSMAYKFDLDGNKKTCKVCGTEFWFYERGKTAVSCGDPICEAVRVGKLHADPVVSVTPAGERFVYDFTVDGSNNFFGNGLLHRQCVDEVDVIEKKNLRAYDQAKGGVPTSRAGMEAMTLFTSTRKSRVGKVQEEIDRAPKTGLLLLHWNIIDITEPCPPSRHRPDEPKQTYFINDADVKHITEAEYDALPDSDKTKWYSAEGYAGCQKCPLFAACKGRLATEQHGKVGAFEDGGTALLMPISEVIDKFRDATPEFIITEYLCRKPDTSGLVYPRLNADIHKRTANQIARMVDPDSKVDTKAELIKFLAEKGARFATGMDFGYNHLFAVVTFAIWGNLAFIIDAIGLPQQELDDKLALTEHLKLWNSTIYADPEDPGSIKTFSRKGYKMKDWSKNSGSVKAGIDIVRTKLYSKALGATVFFLAEDDDIALLFKHVQDYHYTTGPDGKFTETPDDTNDDYPDALRYGIMNVFGKDGGLRNVHTVAVSVPKVNLEHWTDKVERYNKNVMGDIVRGLTGQPSYVTEAEKTEENPNRIKKGSFFWDG